MNTKEFVEKYLTNRQNTSSLKWDALNERFGDPDLLSMWVADMEFRAPEEVVAALTERVGHGIYGYSFVWDSYYEAVIDWHKRHHGLTLERDWFRFSQGVVQAFYHLVSAFTEENDSVIIISPVYYPFHNAVKDNKRNLVRSELFEKDGTWNIDFEDFEKKIIENDVKLFIHCSPHNPVGRIWTDAESETLFSICEKHGVLIVSDEIHQDINVSEKKFIPALNVGDGKFKDNLIVINAASKTFNLACLLNSHLFIANKEIRDKYDEFAKRFCQVEVNLLGLTATEAAYRHGDEWLTGLLGVVKENYDYLKSYFAEHKPQVKVANLEGTYLLWIDMRELVDPETCSDWVRKEAGLAVDFGEWFSDKCKGFIRINLATDPEIIKKAAEKIVAALNK